MAIRNGSSPSSATWLPSKPATRNRDSLRYRALSAKPRRLGAQRVSFVHPHFNLHPQSGKFDAPSRPGLASYFGLPRVPSKVVSDHMKILRKILISQLVVLVFSMTTPLGATGLRPTPAKHAIVVSIHEEASKVGVAILQKGGNAVDAAVATGFALAVVHPAAGKIRGGGLYLLRCCGSES